MCLFIQRVLMHECMHALETNRLSKEAMRHKRDQYRTHTLKMHESVDSLRGPPHMHTFVYMLCYRRTPISTYYTHTYHVEFVRSFARSFARSLAWLAQPFQCVHVLRAYVCTFYLLNALLLCYRCICCLYYNNEHIIHTQTFSNPIQCFRNVWPTVPFDVE